MGVSRRDHPPFVSFLAWCAQVVSIHGSRTIHHQEKSIFFIELCVLPTGTACCVGREAREPRSIEKRHFALLGVVNVLEMERVGR